jgi:FTR1 family protein
MQIRHIPAALGLSLLWFVTPGLAQLPAHGQEAVALETSIKDHRFQLSELKAPANRPITLTVRNLDRALAFVVGIAVLREGSEIVLFLYGLMLSGGSALSLLGGGITGLVLGCGLSFLTYRGLLTIPPRYLFGVTSALIAFLAAGMAAQCPYSLEQANVITLLSATSGTRPKSFLRRASLGEYCVQR